MTSISDDSTRAASRGAEHVADHRPGHDHAGTAAEGLQPAPDHQLAIDPASVQPADATV